MMIFSHGENCPSSCAHLKLLNLGIHFQEVFVHAVLPVFGLGHSLLRFGAVGKQETTIANRAPSE